jgi:vacuolar-type H+-ATPase subunit I/STV1
MPASGSMSTRVIFAFVTGALGLMCCPAGIAGIVLSQLELKAIREGRSPKSNEKLAQIAFYVSIGTTIIGLFIGMMFWLAGMMRQ